ncbi:hypothetical protein C2S51_031129 [Perilla frutescens var. frutescens]|nr:hypothetical protein C2S51_031129 [Perilla frutescens var. frutescens]
MNIIFTDSHNGQVISSLPKHEFSKFDGFNPRACMLKCNENFKVMPNITDEQRIVLASMYFEGKTASWYQNFSSKLVVLNWKQFMEVISARFEDLKEAKIVEEFNQLKHTGDYMEYVARFEELKESMLMFGQGIFTETYFMASFLTGLSEDMRVAINLFSPTSLEQIVELGKNHLIIKNSITKKIKRNCRFCTNPWFRNPQEIPLPNLANSVHSLVENNYPIKTPIKILSVTQMVDRRAQCLCYYYDERYTPGLRCKHRIYLQSLSEVEDYEPPGSIIEERKVSLRALKEDGDRITMRFNDSREGHGLPTLIDTCSTPKILREETPKELGFGIEEATPYLINVADGQRLIYSSKARGFGLTIQGHTLNHSLRFMHHGGCDINMGDDQLNAWCLRNQTLSIYEKEFLVFLMVVQRLTLQTWVTKLPGLDYEIQYRKGTEKRAAKVLSRIHETREGCKGQELRSKALGMESYGEVLILLYDTSKPKHWINWMSLDEDWYNTSLYTALKITLFQALSGYPFPYPATGPCPDVIHGKVNDAIYEKRVMMHQLKTNLQGAENHIATYANSPQNELPKGAREHPLIHVSLHKRTLNEDKKKLVDLPELNDEGLFRPFPISALDSRAVTREREEVNQLLIKRDGKSSDLAFGEDPNILRNKFSTLDPCGQKSTAKGDNMQYKEGIVVGEEIKHTVDGAGIAFNSRGDNGRDERFVKKKLSSIDSRGRESEKGGSNVGYLRHDVEEKWRISEMEISSEEEVELGMGKNTFLGLEIKIEGRGFCRDRVI